MPWKETDAMLERGKFVVEYDSGLWTMTQLCKRYGITRTTGEVVPIRRTVRRQI